MLIGKLAHNVGAPGDQSRWCVPRELGGEEFFVAVTQALRPVHDQDTITLRLLEQVGGVDEFVVEGWILAHQDHVQFGQRRVLFGIQGKPALRVVEYLQRAHAGTGLTTNLVEILLLHIEQRPAACLSGQ